MVLIEEHEDPELPKLGSCTMASKTVGQSMLPTLMPRMPATLHQLISSEDDDGDGRPERDEQPQPNATAQEGRNASLIVRSNFHCSQTVEYCSLR